MKTQANANVRQAPHRLFDRGFRRMSNVKSSPENLSAISTFVCVGESASLTAASHKLQISVSGVSRAISRLEDRLRARLVNRTSRSISLMEALTEAAIQGVGIAYLPDFMVADHVAAGALRILLPDHLYEGEALHMIYPKRRFPSSRSRVVKDFLLKLLPQQAPWSKTVLRFTDPKIGRTAGPLDTVCDCP